MRVLHFLVLILIIALDLSGQRIPVLGQIDLPHNRQSGLIEAQRALQKVEGISLVEFTAKDVVRHPLVQRIITAYELHRGKARSVGE